MFSIVPILRETVSEINRNFVIRYKWDKEDKTRLIGGGKYHELVGEELAKKHFEKALNSPKLVVHFKLRRGLKIVFHGK